MAAKRVFLGGPVRTREDRDGLERIERVLLRLGFEVFVPHKRIGVIPKDSVDLSPLKANFIALRECDLAVFWLDQERTGTGIELGYLASLIELGASHARIFGLAHTGTAPDLMASVALKELGALVNDEDELEASLRAFTQPE